MKKGRLKQWVHAFRLRTLFLAIATVIMASGMAWRAGAFNLTTFILAFLLALTIQILANLANDLGDYLKGTDTTGFRQGPGRAVQSGMISQSEMKGAILLFIIICILLGLALVLNMAKQTDWPSAVILILVGGCSILAALFYTLGGNAYGYRGWGDLFAFLFFGPVPVIGTWFLHTHTLGVQPLLPAISLGLISTMILNVNNMRDIENDRASGKITIAVKLGLKQAKIYHTLMTLTSFICFALYNILYEPAPWYRYAYLIVFLLPFGILYQIRNRSGHQLDPYLKLTSLSGFLLAVAFAICINM